LPWAARRFLALTIKNVGRLMCARRLVRDDERHAAHAKALIGWANITLMARSGQ
jgi:hypothetical protein